MTPSPPSKCLPEKAQDDRIYYLFLSTPYDRPPDLPSLVHLLKRAYHSEISLPRTFNTASSPCLYGRMNSSQQTQLALSHLYWPTLYFFHFYDCTELLLSPSLVLPLKLPNQNRAQFFSLLALVTK
jgi:hypothetical protein